jgi:predicted branched-subunit amino acid permease
MSAMTHVGPRRDELPVRDHRSSLRAGVLAAAPLTVAFAGFGIAFGSLARAAAQVGPPGRDR